MGIHFWKKGRYFVDSAEEFISNDKTIKEHYIAPTYNYLINKGHNITAINIGDNSYHSLGSPQDLKTFLMKKFEFQKKSKKTIICDIDGTLLRHAHGYSRISIDNAKVLDGVTEKMDKWDSENHTIILITARKESARKITEIQLENLGIPWDQLIMNAGGSSRVLINDKLTQSSPDRAISVNLVTDAGFVNYNWQELDL